MGLIGQVVFSHAGHVKMVKGCADRDLKVSYKADLFTTPSLNRPEESFAHFPCWSPLLFLISHDIRLNNHCRRGEIGGSNAITSEGSPISCSIFSRILFIPIEDSIRPLWLYTFCSLCHPDR